MYTSFFSISEYIYNMGCFFQTSDSNLGLHMIISCNANVSLKQISKDFLKKRTSIFSFVTLEINTVLVLVLAGASIKKRIFFDPRIAK